ncbi:transcription initiation factor TFIID subunit 7-like [Choristoneura fumiferana]|uniref:transcription initiation factor TFIID subunit 7-like n=1 Tax=Choristoneura fumiferana TaxID=7141 RepID=UPI003D157AB1
MNKEKREPEYPAELESQFILRLPPEPAKVLSEVLKTGENLKNRLTIQIENDMRHGEVRMDHWLMHAKIVDLPTVVEALKTIDCKSFYKTADIAQMMICKQDPEPPSTDDESTARNKKKDPYKVEKKFLWPHGVTPPTKNIRKRRFRKTLRKKFVEAPEIEKEVKRLLRADNEAVSVTWEIINEEDDQLSKPEPSPSSSYRSEKRTKSERAPKREVTTPKAKATATATAPNPESSNVVDIFGGALSDSDLEEENINVGIENCHLSPYYSRISDTIQDGLHGSEFNSQMFPFPETPKASTSKACKFGVLPVGTASIGLSSEDDSDYQNARTDISKENMSFRINQVKTELDELKQRRQRTQHEISGIENQALRQRFQDVLHTLNQDIMFKDMEYQGLLTLQNSEVI